MSVHVTLRKVLIALFSLFIIGSKDRLSPEACSGYIITLSGAKTTLDPDPFSKQHGGENQSGHMRLNQTAFPLLHKRVWSRDARLLTKG